MVWRKGDASIGTKCIKSWKEHLPDYEFKLWNEENFDINSSEWCKGAYENKKYAFVADYVRLIALYKMVEFTWIQMKNGKESKSIC